MSELNFQTGLKSYTVNGGEEITFEPGSAIFANAVITAFERCQEATRNSCIDNAEDTEAAYKATVELENAIRTEINAAFGYDVCAKVFPNMSAIAVASGLPVWVNFLMAIVDEIDSHMDDSQVKARERVQKYTDKYANKYGKSGRK